ncbi:substrate-binding domain-containing protein [Sphingomonas sp. LR55]
MDNAAASADAIEHLVGLGHRRIGVVTGPEISPISRDRLAGAIDAATRAGLRDSLHIRVGDYSAGPAVDQTRDLLAQDVTAIFCFSDEMAMGALSAIGDAGLSCPKDVSVIGFDDLPLARYFQPPLTTIAQPKAMIGRRTVELLVDILRGVDSPSRQVTLDHELIVRGSTAQPASAR